MRPLFTLPVPGALDVMTGTANALNRTNDAIREFSSSECGCMRASA